MFRLLLLASLMSGCVDYSVVDQEPPPSPGDMVLEQFDWTARSDRVDYLVFLDTSGSMKSANSNDTVHFGSNAEAILAVMEDSGADWRLAVLPMSPGHLVIDDYVEFWDTDKDVKLRSIIGVASGWGYGEENGLSVTLPAVSSAENKEFFFRKRASLYVVYISDEDDGSRLDKTFHNDMDLYLGGTPAVYSAIVGAAPYTTCGAILAVTYLATVDHVVDICARAAWPDAFSHWESPDAPPVFELAKTPIENSIAVWIDGSLDERFSYDASANTVTLDAPPVNDVSVLIGYWPL